MYVRADGLNFEKRVLGVRLGRSTDKSNEAWKALRDLLSFEIELPIHECVFEIRTVLLAMHGSQL